MDLWQLITVPVHQAGPAPACVLALICRLHTEHDGPDPAFSLDSRPKSHASTLPWADEVD